MGNLLSPGICETNTGDIIIVWGGRRIATRYLTPSLEAYTAMKRRSPGVKIEQVWKRRIAWEAGPVVATRLFSDMAKREDYPAVTIGRNPSIIQGAAGRYWLGYRIPVITTQDTFGAYYSENIKTPGSDGYFRTENIGTTAGLNFWQVSRRADIRDFIGAFPFRWTEQVDVMIPPTQPEDDLIFDPSAFTVTELIQRMGLGWAVGAFLGENPGGRMDTCWTQHRLTGELMLRGQGGNIMDLDDPTRWKWNEPEGLSPDWEDAEFNPSGQQTRIRGGQISSVRGDRWVGDITTLPQTGKALTFDFRGKRWTANYSSRQGEIPWQVIEEGRGVITDPPPPVDDIKAWEAWEDEQMEWYYAWANDNRREWVIDNANVPHEGFFSWEIENLDTPEARRAFWEEQEKLRQDIAETYYELPETARAEQRPAYLITKSGLQVIAWLHGNLTAAAIPGSGKTHAVGLRVAVSRDGGRSFEPLIPARQNTLDG